MTTYKEYAKQNYHKKFQGFDTYTDPVRAEKVAIRDCEFFAHVKIIVTDDNGIKNEIIYK